MHYKVISLSLLLSGFAAASTMPHLPLYEPEEYSSVDRVVDAGKCILKSALGAWALKNALENLEKFLDRMPNACHEIKQTREQKTYYYPRTYGAISTYATRMPRVFIEPMLNLVTGSALLYISYRLVKSAWRSFKQATQSTSVQRYNRLATKNCCKV